MNESNELLMHIYKTVSMGVESTTSLLRNLKNRDNKIKGLVEEELKEYESYLKECEKLLKKNKIEFKKTNIMARISSEMGIMMETMKDNSDSAIASMLSEGFIMGVTEMDGKINSYKKYSDSKSLKIAKKVLKFQENEIKKLKAFI